MVPTYVEVSAVTSHLGHSPKGLGSGRGSTIVLISYFSLLLVFVRFFDDPLGTALHWEVVPLGARGVVCFYAGRVVPAPAVDLPNPGSRLEPTASPVSKVFRLGWGFGCRLLSQL